MAKIRTLYPKAESEILGVLKRQDRKRAEKDIADYHKKIKESLKPKKTQSL